MPSCCINFRLCLVQTNHHGYLCEEQSSTLSSLSSPSVIRTNRAPLRLVYAQKMESPLNGCLEGTCLMVPRVFWQRAGIKFQGFWCGLRVWIYCCSYRHCCTSPNRQFVVLHFTTVNKITCKIALSSHNPFSAFWKPSYCVCAFVTKKQHRKW